MKKVSNQDLHSALGKFGASPMKASDSRITLNGSPDNVKKVSKLMKIM